jgi:His-Xaa-Ser system protein HxsD
MTGIQCDVRTTVYPLESIYAACYAFIDRAYIRLDERPKQTIRVILDAKEPLGKDALRRLEGEFRNELLHHALRLKVSVSNQKIREYIVTRALLSAQAAPPPDAAGQPVDQAPLGDQTAPEVRQPGPDGEPVAAPMALPAPETGGEADGKEHLVQSPRDEAQPAQARPQAAPADDALTREIQKLLAEIDKGGEQEDPLGIIAPWEEKAPKSPKDAEASEASVSKAKSSGRKPKSVSPRSSKKSSKKGAG